MNLKIQFAIFSTLMLVIIAGCQKKVPPASPNIGLFSRIEGTWKLSRSSGGPHGKDAEFRECTFKISGEGNAEWKAVLGTGEKQEMHGDLMLGQKQFMLYLRSSSGIAIYEYEVTGDSLVLRPINALGSQIELLRIETPPKRKASELEGENDEIYSVATARMNRDANDGKMVNVKGWLWSDSNGTQWIRNNVFSNDEIKLRLPEGWGFELKPDSASREVIVRGRYGAVDMKEDILMPVHWIKVVSIE